MKNKISVLALLVVLSFTATACTIQDLPVIGKFFGAKTFGPVTLNVWGMWENPDIMKTLIKKYQETRPNVTINYDDRSVLKPADYKDRVFARAGQTSSADVMLVHNSWVSKLKDSLVPMPSTIMDTQKYSSTFYPVSTDSAVFDGKVYGMPLYYDGLVLVYNKQHFQEIGQTDIPTAWEEFRRLALKLTVRSGEKGDVMVRAGAAIGNASNVDHFSDILGLMWSQAHVKIPTELDTRAAQDALSFYTNFVKEDRVWESNFPEATAAFVQEKVSMIFVPSWQVLDIINARPDLDIGVAPVPQAITQDPVNWGSFWMEVVPNTSKNPQVAWDFINFLTQEEQQMTLFSEQSKLRPFGNAYSIVTLGKQLESNPYLGSLATEASTAKSAEIAARSGNALQEKALSDAVNAVLSGSTPADALKKAKEDMAK